VSARVFESLNPASRARREAAAWVARMHAPDRSASVDAAFKRWLESNPLNREAFELANDVWDGVARLPRAASPSGLRPRRAWALAAMLGAVSIGTGFLGWQAFQVDAEPIIRTAVGEQRTLTLQDGSRVSLNTATRIVVEYDGHRRLVRLEGGEALFEVAARPDRPFVVVAGRRQITALGTSFLVRDGPRALSVTLVDGRVKVAATAGGRPGARTMAPGERLTYRDDGSSALDRPNLERLMSWRQGRVMMDHTPLGEAVAELNRYSALPLVVEDAQTRALRVSGIFRVGDPLLFARAIAATYGLEIEQDTDRIVLAGAPVGH
jgi:transmembrane sensor